jgi:hypothetical protein
MSVLTDSRHWMRGDGVAISGDDPGIDHAELHFRSGHRRRSIAMTTTGPVASTALRKASRTKRNTPAPSGSLYGCDGGSFLGRGLGGFFLRGKSVLPRQCGQEIVGRHSHPVQMRMLCWIVFRRLIRSRLNNPSRLIAQQIAEEGDEVNRGIDIVVEIRFVRCRLFLCFGHDLPNAHDAESAGSERLGVETC